MMRKRMEKMRKRMGGRSPFGGAADVGWGKARKDITWVKEDKGPF